MVKAFHRALSRGAAGAAEIGRVLKVGHRLGVIDGLRGIAILVVVWIHVWQQCWRAVDFHVGPLEINLQPLAETGYLGVSLFFFISGFVIALPFVEAKFLDRPAPTLSNFYWRRFLKIVPSYWLNIVVCLALGVTFTSLYGPPWRSILTHLAFIHNWDINDRMAINGVLWTLAVEVQFYAIAPFLIALFLRWPAVVFALSVGSAILWRIRSYTTDGTLLDFRMDQMPGNLDLFTFGILTAYLFVLVESRHPKLAARAAGWTVLGIAGALASLALVNWCYAVRYDHNGWGGSYWQLQYRTLLAAAIGMTALGSLFAARWWKRTLANPVLLFLAAISYNLYLWHDVVALMSERYRIPNWHTPRRYDDPVWGTTYLIVVPIAAIVVATIVTYGFERPILRFKNADPIGALLRTAGFRPPLPAREYPPDERSPHRAS